MKKLLVNALMCLRCGDTIESLYTKPQIIVKCTCGSIGLCGGLDSVVYWGKPGAAYSLLVYDNLPYHQLRCHRYLVVDGEKVVYAAAPTEMLQQLLDDPDVQDTDEWCHLLEEKLYRLENEII